MLDNNGFDEWAGDYDESIEKYSQGYPFEGYYNVLGYVGDLINLKNEVKILDLGIGTGLLTNELYKNGGQIYGVDFSKKMLERAQKKMPNGVFHCFDFTSGLPEALDGIKFDYIVSSYAFHHISDDEKVKFIDVLRKQLKEAGEIIIADVSFETNEEMIACQESSTNRWDDEEFYMIAENILPKMKNIGLDVSYRQISSCAGVFIIK